MTLQEPMLPTTGRPFFSSFPSPTPHPTPQPYPSPHRAEFSPHNNTFEHARPPLRTAMSSSSGIMARDEGGSPTKDNDLDRDELTTKGRKRKRLAKACSACHKNKRRCDGFAPCSNCEFSSRPCLYLNAQGEPIPPPRSRELSQVQSKKDDKGRRRSSGDLKDDDTDPRANPEHRTDVLKLAARDPSIGAELIELFFRHVHPFSAMFHPATFHHRLFLDQVPQMLIDIISALASRYCDSPAFLSVVPPMTPPFARGEAYAERAAEVVQWVIKEDRGVPKGSWEETELAQTLVLLGVYYSTGHRQREIGIYFLDIAATILHPAPSATLPPPSSHLALSTAEYLTLMEIRHRTFWALILLDLSFVPPGRSRRIAEAEMYNIPLPGSEVLWNRRGGSSSTGREGGRRDGLVVGTGNWTGEDGQVGELGHVMRILAIYTDIRLATASSPSRLSINHHEHALKSWAMTLPPHLRFGETTLNLAVSRLASPVASTVLAGWMYAYMHILAECGMFHLQASADRGAGQRQSQVVDNLVVLLDALGEAGRANPQIQIPLSLITNWLSSNQVPQLEVKVDTWWNELCLRWGIERLPISPSTVIPLHHRSSLGLYHPTNTTQASPIPGPDSASTSSTLTLPTPNMRYPYPQLPPLRPRAASTSVAITKRSPSPVSKYRHLPSMSALTDPKDAVGTKIELPPLDLGSRYKPMGTFFEDRFSSGGRPRALTGTSMASDLVSPRRRDLGSYSASNRDSRPLSPLSKPWDRIDERASPRQAEVEKVTRHSRDEDGEGAVNRGMTGIEALANAAEVRDRERSGSGSA
ncbi:hypothetical protein BCR39DRAFT_187902 [Naematelia encephala]|uniref:Zn(2)-C6 fungal-type domain-containing protein n=1 Tax=Naematelia encephala TaxID=71784 RepID=A0A1Y2B2V7_9TREE|nr:hypothetical protein BCR39DRAFT_187902 [Naematelia encephala]